MPETLLICGGQTAHGPLIYVSSASGHCWRVGEGRQVECHSLRPLGFCAPPEANAKRFRSTSSLKGLQLVHLGVFVGIDVCVLRVWEGLGFLKSKVGDAENFGLSFHKNAQNPLRLTKSLIHPNSTKLLPSKQLKFFHDSVVAKKPADCSGRALVEC